MLTIWFIGMYVIFILQQITILYLVCKIGSKTSGFNKKK